MSLKKELIIAHTYNNKYINNENQLFFSLAGSSFSADLNRAKSIQSLARKKKSEYISWINTSFFNNLSRNIYKTNIPIFFLTEIFSKRNDRDNFFYILICLLEIKKIVKDSSVERIILYGVDEMLANDIKATFKNIQIAYYSKKSERDIVKKIRRFLSAIIFYFNIFIFKLLSKNENKVAAKNNLYFSIYPNHFTNGQSKVYGKSIKKDDFLLSLFSDGYHTKKSFFESISIKNKYPKSYFLEDYFSIKDFKDTFLRYLKLNNELSKLKTDIKNEPIFFDGISCNSIIIKLIDETKLRFPRIIIWHDAFNRFLDQNKIKNFSYYLHEYTFGRLLTFILNDRNIPNQAYQHGPNSKLKLFLYNYVNTSTQEESFLNKVKLPMQIFAEDDDSKKIYLEGGYKNVEVMKEVHRLNYLKHLKITSINKFYRILVIAGLSDGEKLMGAISSKKINFSSKKIYFRPHPRANNAYLKEKHKDVYIDKDLLENSILKSDEIYVTYSSVGKEAVKLGKKVNIIYLNGSINLSELDEFDHPQISRIFL